MYESAWLCENDQRRGIREEDEREDGDYSPWRSRDFIGGGTSCLGRQTPFIMIVAPPSMSQNGLAESRNEYHTVCFTPKHLPGRVITESSRMFIKISRDPSVETHMGACVTIMVKCVNISTLELRMRPCIGQYLLDAIGIIECKSYDIVLRL